MPDIDLTLAINDYDHVRDLFSGRVKPEGIRLTCLQLPVEEIFFRFAQRQEWEVSEMSMGMYSSAVSRGDAPWVGIPVFPSRVFRQSAFFVRADGPVKRPADLAGRKVGMPQWSQTATIYARGWLQHQIGIPLARIQWVQSGVNDPGRPEPSRISLPDGVTIAYDTRRSLTELLLDGDIDCIISAHPPHAFEHGDPRIVRLVQDYRAVEEAYFADTGIFPIMHTIAIRRDAFEANRWIARNLYVAFDEAKRRSVARLKDITASQVALPWGESLVEELGRKMYPGHDYWPYGIEANRTTIDAFLQYCHEQGVCAKRLAPEELYPKEGQFVLRV